MTRYHSILASRPLGEEEMNKGANNMKEGLPMFYQPIILILLLYILGNLVFRANSPISGDDNLPDHEE